jgi:hypothetical protein
MMAVAASDPSATPTLASKPLSKPLSKPCTFNMQAANMQAARQLFET